MSGYLIALFSIAFCLKFCNPGLKLCNSICVILKSSIPPSSSTICFTETLPVARSRKGISTIFTYTLGFFIHNILLYIDNFQHQSGKRVLRNMRKLGGYLRVSGPFKYAPSGFVWGYINAFANIQYTPYHNAYANDPSANPTQFHPVDPRRHLSHST